MILRIFSLIVLFASCSDKQENRVEVSTQYGDFEIEVYPSKAPLTVNAFLKNVEGGIYKDAAFYRVLKAEQLPSDYNSGIIQGGVYKSKKVADVPSIPHETTHRSGLSHTDGIVSMARTKPGTASSEFFICIGDQSPLDSGRRGTPDGLGMAAFGKVVKGMDIVRKIQNQKSSGDSFLQPIEIHNIRLL